MQGKHEFLPFPVKWIYKSTCRFPLSVSSRWIFLLTLFFLMISPRFYAQVLELRDWTYFKAGDSAGSKAVVPGSVHLDLLRDGLMPDPFKGVNEKKVQWVGETDWIFMTRFYLDESFRNKDVINLELEGIDTYAQVYLNDSLILKADNMFRRWTVPVRKLLRDANVLRVEFTAPEKIASAEAARLSYTLPEGLRSFTRKAQYHYGWDWGPRLLTCGIGKPVKLVAFDETRMESLSIRQLSLRGDTVKGVALVKMENTKRRKGLLLLNCLSGFSLLHEFTAEPGLQEVAIPFTMTGIRRWEVNGRGEQPLYSFTCRDLQDTLSWVKCTTGFRNLELIQEKDSAGVSFGFRVNGRDLFVRGANIIPPDIFMSRVTAQDLENLVLKARDANMNMLRVWGGGVYLPDEFYHYCDKYGILVWQDFMFACSMVPGDAAFVENVRHEAIYQIGRISSHPSLALWCGNNESDEGWHNWGWQKQFGYTIRDSATVWENYERIFHGLLPSLVDSLDPGRFYWPSSPSLGWGRKESLTRGDCHYWGVWWGMEPFEAYREKTGRFMSEYGFQSLPHKSAWNGVADTVSLSSLSIKNHQKHPKGFETIDLYLDRYYGRPAAFDDYTWLSQLQQAYGMKTAFEAHRSRYPYCRGTLFWQLNDCWPAISWSVLDADEWEKLAYSTARHAFDSLFIGLETAKGRLSAPLHYDGRDEMSVTIRLMALKITDGSLPVILDERSLRLRPDTVIPSVLSYPLNQLGSLDTSETVYVVEAEDNYTFRTVYRNYMHHVAPRSLKLMKTSIQVTPVDEQSVVLLSDFFAYGVYLYDDAGRCVFEDNGFHLLPGEIRRVKYRGGPSSIRVKCLNELNGR